MGGPDEISNEAARYREFVRTSTAAIWRFELEEPVPVSLPEDEQIALFYERAYLAECNGAFARLYGLPSAEAAVGARLGVLLPRERPENVAYLRAAVRSGYRLEDAESVEYDAEGSERRFSNSLVGVVEGGVLVRAWGIQRDITELCAREGRRSRAILESITDGYFALGADWRFTYVNPQAERVLGRAPGDLTGRVIWDEYPGLIGSEFERAYRRAAGEGGGGAAASTVTAYYPDHGRWYEVHVYPAPDEAGGAGGGGGGEGGGITIYFRDVSERERQAAALREAEELARTIAENSTQGMAMMDGRGYCTYANRAWLAMTGYTDEEIRSKPLHYLVHHSHPDGRPYPMEECPIDRALPENSDVRAHEDLFFRKDGTMFPVLVAASPIFKDGRPVSTVIEIRDVTEQKRAEGQRRAFLREVLSSMTEGRLRLCDSAADLPAPVAPEPTGPPVALSRATLRDLRRQVCSAAAVAELPNERAGDLLTAVGEASMNAVVHAGGGEGRVYADRAGGLVQVRVEDGGRGLSEETVHRAVLEKGYSSAGTLGHGFWLMLQTADRISLLTGPQGTTVVLEQGRAAPEPGWASRGH